MNINRRLRKVAWLLIAMQLLSCVAYADTTAQSTVFSPVDYMGGYTVRFLDETGAEIYQETDIAFETEISAIIDRLVQTKPDYADAIWSVTKDYLVLNNVDVMMVGEAVARVGDALYPTLQQAIEADSTVAGSTILLLKDTAESVDSKGKSFTLDMGGHTLRAAADETSVFSQTGGTVTLLQGTITGAKTSSYGGGIYVNGGKFTGKYLKVTNNGANYMGCGLYAGSGAEVTLEHCFVSKNYNTKWNTHGAGIGVEDGVTLTVRSTTISENRDDGISSGYGLGLHATDSTVELENCTISGHSSAYGMMQGAGIYVEDSTLRASSTTVKDNALNGSSGSGGGIYSKDSDVTLTGCTITGNYAQYDGGGIYADEGSLTIKGGSVSNNRSGDMTGGIEASYAALKAVGVEISGNTGGSGDVGVGGAYLNAYAELIDCTISNNTGGTGGLYLNVSKSSDMKIQSRITGNTGLQYAGGVYVAMKYDLVTQRFLNGAVITGNTGLTAGGIHAAGKVVLMSEGAVYGNKATDGKGGNDLTIEKAMSVSLMAANAMADGEHSFEDYRWIGGEGTETLAVGEGISRIQSGRYTAGVLYDVAENVTSGEVYTSLEEAMAEAQENDEIRLIAADEEGNPIPISGDFSLNRALTLDLNGRTLYGGQTVESAGVLTLTGQGALLQMAQKGDYPLVIEAGGSVIIDGGMTVGGVDLRTGAELALKSAESMGAIQLPDGMTVAAGGAFNPSALEFVLPSETVERLNEGYKNPQQVEVPLITALPGEILSDGLADRIAIRDAGGMVSVEKDDTGMIAARSVMLNGVYADGSSGDDQNDGLTPDTPVKTFARAKEVLEGMMSAQTLADEVKDQLEGIYVMDALQVEDSQKWSLPGGKLLMRHPDYKDELVKVTGSLTLAEITLDGGAQRGFESYEAMVLVEGGALAIQKGAVLRNNRHTKDRRNVYYQNGGGAVKCVGGSVAMSGGEVSGNTSWYGGGIFVWNGQMTLSGGSISGNRVRECGTIAPAGGGVMVMGNSEFKMQDGAISGNSGADNGGGLMVGGLYLHEIENFSTAFIMSGGSITGNRASKEGGGIFVQSETTARISGGTISGNSSASGHFGGGGIYVNGGRSGEYGVADGRLYLTNLLMSGNSASLEGGGLAGCSTSSTNIYLQNGGAVFDNQGPNQVFIDGGTLGGFLGSPRAVISPYMLGGGAYNWAYATSGDPVSPSSLAKITGTAHLNNAPDGEAISRAQARASVRITGNRSNTRGGGIGSNGFVQIGTPPVDGSWTPQADKKLTGRDMAAGEFTFTVTENGQTVSTGTNKAAASGQPAGIEFTPIPYKEGSLGEKHTYRIEEVQNGLPVHVTGDRAGFTVQVTVVEGPGGKLTAEVNEITVDGVPFDEVVFNNRYDVKPAGVKLAVNKTVENEGGSAPDDGLFTFSLAGRADNPQGAALPQNTTASLQGGGVAEFEEITFSRPGVYAFEIRETAGKDPSYVYDPGVWTAVVEVVDDGSAALVVNSVRYTHQDSGKTSDQHAAFVNTYITPAAYEPVVVKEIVGETPPAAKSFTFTLAAGDGNPTGGAALPSPAEVVCSGAGEAKFGAIRFVKAGVYEFIIAEAPGSDAGYTYDAAAWTLKVEVVKEGDALKIRNVTYQRMKDGQMQTSGDHAVFTNRYDVLPTDIRLKVKKTVDGLTPKDERFTFLLAEQDGNPEGGAELPANVQTMVAGSGEASFEAIRFNKAGIYRFEITERNDRKPGYSYDGSVWTAVVEVADGGNQLRVETVRYEKQGVQSAGETFDAAEFVNLYMPGVAEYRPLARKQLTGSRPPQDKRFVFELTALDNPENGAQLPNVTTAERMGEGMVEFQPIRFDRAGTYTFQIAEQPGTDAGYRYDDGRWTLTVTVTDKDGVLTVDGVGYAKADGTQADMAGFVNEYAPSPASAEIVGEKQLTGEPQSAETFAFRLMPRLAANPMPAGSGADGAEVEIVGGGSFSFGTIDYEEAGVYLYTVHEVKGDALGYVYDETLYEVAVTVKDQGGILQAQTAYRRSDGLTAEKALFVNAYEVGSLTIEKQVKGSGASREEAFEFTVKLTDAKGQPLSGAYPYVGLGGAASGRVENGIAVFELRHGQGIRIEKLPVGARYAVEEAEHEGYSVQADKASGTVTAEGVQARFTNVRNRHADIPKTGYGESNTRYWMIAGCLLVALLAGIGRRKLNPRNKRS